MSAREPHPFPDGPDAGDEPHDVLAAEEFPIPSPDAAIHDPAPPELPPDPTGLEEPHDVLAAEQFAMPAPRHHAEVVPAAGAGAGASRTPLLAGVAAAGLGLVALLLRRRAR